MKENLLKARTKSETDLKSGGPLLFAIAFAAILTFLILGYLRFSGESKISQPSNVVRHEGSQNSVAAVEQERRDKIQEKLPENKSAMVPAILEDFEGEWVTKFKSGAFARFKFRSSEFEVEYLAAPGTTIRKHSRGYFKYDEKTGKITLYPSKNGPMEPESGITYKMLTARQYDMYISKKRDDTAALYFIAPEYQISSKSYYPLFSYADFGGAPVLRLDRVVAAKESK